jgi:hypothetical protein
MFEETERAKSERQGPHYRQNVLGYGSCIAVNSLAPFGGFTTTSTDDPARSPFAQGSFYARIKLDPTPRELKLSRESGVIRNRMLANKLVAGTTQAVSQQTSEHERTLLLASRLFEPGVVMKGAAVRLVLPSPISLAAGVAEWADKHGLAREVDVVGDLCMQMVSGARRVVVALSHDPEDGSTGLVFTTFTAASVEDVVGAEDDLHKVLFARVEAAKIVNFSIAYDFIH